LRENQRVSYELEQDRRGKTSAVNLKSADDAAQDEAAPQEEQATDEAPPATEA
jgi:cold shock protein